MSSPSLSSCGVADNQRIALSSQSAHLWEGAMTSLCQSYEALQDDSGGQSCLWWPRALFPFTLGCLWLKLSPCESSAPGAVPHPLPEPENRATSLTCFLVSTSRMSIRLIMMFLCVFLYFPTRSETVSQPGRPVHMKVLLPCSFHSRTCRHRQRLSWPPRDPLAAYSPAFRRRGGEQCLCLSAIIYWGLNPSRHLEEWDDERPTGLTLWTLLG